MFLTLSMETMSHSPFSPTPAKGWFAKEEKGTNEQIQALIQDSPSEDLHPALG